MIDRQTGVSIQVSLSGYSFFTPKFTLVPQNFFTPVAAREALAEVVELAPGEAVEWVKVEQYGAVLIYSLGLVENLSRALSQSERPAVDARPAVLPEMYHMLKALKGCEDYNKIVASYKDGYLYLAIAQGHTLQLANAYKAPDFTTAEYFLFLAVTRLQLNPELSTVCFRTPLSADEELSLYRYFKAVEQI